MLKSQSCLLFFRLLRVRVQPACRTISASNSTAGFSLLPLVSVSCNVARIATEKTEVVLDTTFAFLRLQLSVTTQLVGVTRRSRPHWSLAFVTVGRGANG